MRGPFPPQDRLVVLFAHVAYQMAATFEQRGTGIRHSQAWSRDELNARIPEADILVVSGLWRNDLLERASRLRFIQSIGAGVDQFPQDELRRRGIRLASARGVNRNAVSEHAFALILALARQIHTSRDNQHRRHYRALITDLAKREDELGGKTLGIIGLGAIGSRVAALGKAFGMRVVATKRNPAVAEGPADVVLSPARLPELLREADFVVLNCPLTPETQAVINRDTLALMKPSAYLVNVARGACVDEHALVDALKSGRIAGAALDHFIEEPLPSSSALWGMENVIITPHTAGETRLYESNVVDILLDNLGRLSRGSGELRNQVV
jgi:phosphoglycerate dehydrogenase-like enzyme